MPTARRIDDNGFLLVSGCPISSFGIFDYSAGQLGLPGDPMRIVKVFRPESAVNDPAAIDSFKNVPLINDHEMLSGFQGDKENTAPEDYGLDGVLTGNVYYEAPWMRGDLKVFSRKMQNDLSNGKKDLSLGYSCDFEEKPGVWNGQAYEVVQTNLRGNHVALVSEGRVPGARVLDGLCFDHLSFDFKPSDKETTMPKPFKAMDKAARDSAVETLQTLVPQLAATLKQLLTEEGAEPEHQASAEPSNKDDDVVGQIEGNANPAQAPPESNDNSSAESEPADPVAEPSSAPVAEPAEQSQEGAGTEGSGDLQSITQQAQALLQQAQALLQQLAGLTNGQAQDNDDDTAEVGDNVEGLNEQSNVQGAQVSTDTGATGSPMEDDAPEVGATKAQDAAVRRFYADFAAKDSLYQRLSTVVGAFDHKALDARQVAVYGVKKLGIKCADGTEAIALDAFLSGVEKAATQNRKTGQVRAADTAVKASTAEMDQYLGSK